MAPPRRAAVAEKSMRLRQDHEMSALTFACADNYSAPPPPPVKRLLLQTVESTKKLTFIYEILNRNEFKIERKNDERSEAYARTKNE